MAKFKKATSYFDVAAEKAEERQQKIVESASEHQKPAPQVRKAGRPKKGAEGASEACSAVRVRSGELPKTFEASGARGGQVRIGYRSGAFRSLSGRKRVLVELTGTERCPFSFYLGH